MKKLLLYFTLICSLFTSIVFTAGCSSTKVSDSKPAAAAPANQSSSTLLSLEDLKTAQQTPDGLIKLMAKIEYDLFKSNFSDDSIKDMYLVETKAMVKPITTDEKTFIEQTKSGWEKEKGNYGRLIGAIYTTLKDMVKSGDKSMNGAVEINFDNISMKKGYMVEKKEDGLWYIVDIKDM